MQRRVCQDPCYLKNNVSRFLIGETEIKNCEIMSKDPLNPICLSCHHSYSFHSVVSFDTKLDLSREEIITAAIEDLENEKKTIQISLAKFAHFLSHNALTPYNDVYRQYLQILIEK